MLGRNTKGARVAALAATAAALALGVAACGGSSDSGASSGGVVNITLWHGQNQLAQKTLDGLVDRFNSSHPKIHVDSQTGALADSLYSKTTAALAGGKYPDVVYQFGPNIPSLARSPKSVDLNNVVRGPGWNWNDFYPAARDAVTVNAHIHAVPAVIDALAVVYNKRLFRAAGVPLPKDGWTWDDFRATARRLTDKSKGQFGTGWPGVGDEDTVWRIWPMIWQLGGNVANTDGTQAAFGGQPGLRAFTFINQMSAQDKSVYIDKTAGSEQLYRVFNSNHMAMVPTGPWELPEIAQSKIDYGVVKLPSFGGAPTTISGPDGWMVFDNGSARVKAAETFVQWLTQPAQDAKWDISAGSLPLRQSTAQNPVWRRHAAQMEGLSTFVAALGDARVRPALTQYPKLSRALGQQIVAMLLGTSSPQAALNKAVSGANDALSSNR